MKLRVEATPEELESKGPALLRSLASRLGVDPLALLDDHQLEKAGVQKEPQLKHAALRDLHDRERDLVRRTYRAMLREIAEVVLDPAVKKSVDYSAEIVARDAELYEKVRGKLRSRGYDEVDFDEGGRFYGMSTNQLVDFLED